MSDSMRTRRVFLVIAGVLIATASSIALAQTPTDGGPTQSPAVALPSIGMDDSSRGCEGILCAHGFADNAAWREAVSALIGERVDRYNTREGTPTAQFLQQYCCVITTGSDHQDRFALGSVLADYVDAGGKVILGIGSYAGFWGASLTPAEIVTEAYCPVEVSTVYRGSYSRDPEDWTTYFGLMHTYWPRSTDRIALRDGALSDGEIFGTGRPAIAWRPDGRVYYVAGLSIWTSPETGSAALIASIYTNDGSSVGACCDPTDGTCEDNVEAADCRPPLAFYEDESCATLDPPCGNIGCCCHDDYTRTVELEVDCDGRFEPGITGTECTASDPFGPPCAERVCSGILYAPTYMDYPTWRAQLSQMINAPVDYFDAENGTPTLETLQQYCCVFTWGHNTYDDRMAFGSVLADFVDGGGQVILGQGSYQRFGGGFPVTGEILDPAYCPITISTTGSGTYAGDGVDCVHALVPVAGYSSPFTERMILHPGAQSDGTILESSTPAVAWRPDRLVYYLAGNSGPIDTTGDAAAVVANAYLCTGAAAEGACCDPEWGDCIDGIDSTACQPPKVYHPWMTCDMLDPPCGNPGCCCFVETGQLLEMVESECIGRFMPGVLGEACWGDDAFTTAGLAACAEYHYLGILYAPAGPDDPAWRAELEELTGSQVVYFDARIDTPYRTELRNYKAILTWADEPYHNAALFGERLAYMADWNRLIVLGRGSWEHFGGFTDNPAAILNPAQCPVVVDGHGGPDSYAGDGVNCIHTNDVSPSLEYSAADVDYVTVRDGAESDGTFASSGRPAAVWGRDEVLWRWFYYLPAFTGGINTTGDTAQLIANSLYCMEASGACCDPVQGTCEDDKSGTSCVYPRQWYHRLDCPELDPPCGEDCDGNGIADVDQTECTDITLFLDQLIIAEQDPAYVCMFDCNEDTALDGQDIQGFVARLVAAP